MEKYAIMAGGPQSGFTFYGSFEFPAEAIEYAEEEITSESWWVVTLIEPDKTGGDEARDIERMASALAISEGYNPNDHPISEWDEIRSRYMDRAEKLLNALASEQQELEDDPLEQPDTEDDDD